MRMLRFKRHIIRGIILVCFICCFSTATSTAATDYSPTEGWRASTPEKQGMKSGMLANMVENIKEKGYAIESITIIRNGYIVMDVYFYPFTKDTKHILHSCTKSITSALVGIALNKGYIKKAGLEFTETEYKVVTGELPNWTMDRWLAARRAYDEFETSWLAGEFSPWRSDLK